jgi:hypothetical protein
MGVTFVPPVPACAVLPPVAGVLGEPSVEEPQAIAAALMSREIPKKRGCKAMTP